MACRLLTSNPVLGHYLFIVNSTLGNKLQRNSSQNTQVCFHEIVWKAKLSYVDNQEYFGRMGKYRIGVNVS